MANSDKKKCEKSHLLRSLLFDFESKDMKPIYLGSFLIRFLLYFFMSVILFAIIVCIGAFGYNYFEGLSCHDSFHMASLTMTGQGPIVELTQPSAKIFSSFYAVISTSLLLILTGITLIPFGHRIHHRVHHINKKEVKNEESGREF